MVLTSVITTLFVRQIVEFQKGFRKVKTLAWHPPIFREAKILQQDSPAGANSMVAQDDTLRIYGR